MDKENKTIIIVDDDKSILQVFSRILQKQGYETDVAETGEEVIEKLNKRSYDLALIDIKLPDINGTELLRRINLTNPKMIKIMITGFPSIEDGIRALDSGSAAYLVKPVKSEELLRIIAEKLKET